MSSVVKWAGIAFTVVFAVLWLGLSWQVVVFDANSQTPPLPVNPTLVVVAGFLATTVGNVTAGWLGIEIRKPPAQGLGTSTSLWQRLREIFGHVDVVPFACATYLLVTVVVLLVSIFRSDVAPQVYQAFMLSGLGWIAGAFTAAKPPAP